MILERRPDETKLQHHKRIVRGKLVDKSLSDFDYTVLSKYLYGREYASDVARRMFYGSCRTLMIVDEEIREGVSNSNISKEIDDKINELKKETQKFRDQRREFSKLISAEGRFENLCERLIDSIHELNQENPLVAFRNPRLLEPRSDKEALLVFSDWHYGLVTDNISNTYNTDICKQRVDYVVDRTIERLNLHKCKKLHIMVLGDMIHGSIHTSARVASEELTCEQLIKVSELLAQVINKLSEFVPEIKVYVTYGNHARVIPNKQDSIHRDNFERVIPWWLTERFSSSPNISVVHDSGNEFITAVICGHGIAATHGDLDSVLTTDKTYPILCDNYFGENGVRLEAVIIGDKHHFEIRDGYKMRSIICGSLCGSDDYANSKRLYSDPSQLLMIIDSEVGIDAMYTINC